LRTTKRINKIGTKHISTDYNSFISNLKIFLYSVHLYIHILTPESIVWRKILMELMCGEKIMEGKILMLIW